MTIRKEDHIFISSALKLQGFEKGLVSEPQRSGFSNSLQLKAILL
jgi:hypothetical protein